MLTNHHRLESNIYFLSGSGAGRFQTHRFDVLTADWPYKTLSAIGLTRIIEPVVPMVVNSDPAERH